MRAAVVTRYGPPEGIRVREAAKPAPADDEVLIRVHAASVNRTDCGEPRAHPVLIRLFTGLLRPRRTILGLDVAGEVEAVGAAIVPIRPGERVFGLCPSRRNGAQADYVCVPERVIAPMPAGAQFPRGRGRRRGGEEGASAGRARLARARGGGWERRSPGAITIIARESYPPDIGLAHEHRLS